MCCECLQSVCPCGCPNYEPKAVYYCESCGAEICDGDYYYEILGSRVCESCVKESRTQAEASLD